MNALLLPFILSGVVVGMTIANRIGGLTERKRILRWEFAGWYLEVHEAHHVEIMKEGERIQQIAEHFQTYDREVALSGGDRQAFNKEADWLEEYSRQFTEDVQEQLKTDHEALWHFPKGYDTVICPEHHSKWDTVREFADTLQHDFENRRIHR